MQSCHETLLWIIPQLDKFPRNRRFTLGDRIETGLLDVLELLVQATYARKNQTILSKANNKLAVVRHLWRLAFELKTIAMKQYEYGAKMLVEIGKQIGGWLKHKVD